MPKDQTLLPRKLSVEDTEFVAKYQPTDYPPNAVTADVILLTIRSGRLAVLLVERANPPQSGSWALPGGHLRPEESIHETALRELAEKLDSQQNLPT